MLFVPVTLGLSAYFNTNIFCTGNFINHFFKRYFYFWNLQGATLARFLLILLLLSILEREKNAALPFFENSLQLPCPVFFFFVYTSEDVLSSVLLLLLWSQKDPRPKSIQFRKIEMRECATALATVETQNVCFIANFSRVHKGAFFGGNFEKAKIKLNHSLRQCGTFFGAKRRGVRGHSFSLQLNLKK